MSEMMTYKYATRIDRQLPQMTQKVTFFFRETYIQGKESENALYNL